MSTTKDTRDHRHAKVLAALTQHDAALRSALEPFWQESAKWARLKDMLTTKPDLSSPASPREAGELWSFFTVPATAIVDIDGPEWAQNQHAVAVNESGAEDVSFSWEGEHQVGTSAAVAAHLAREDHLNLRSGEYTVGPVRIALLIHGTYIDVDLADDLEAVEVADALAATVRLYRRVLSPAPLAA